MKNTEKQIEEKVAQAVAQSIFFNEDFRAFGSAEAVKVALHRLVNKKVLARLGIGIYVKADFSKLLNKEILPGPEEIVKAIAKRDRAKIIPTGNYALNVLGLSTQVPMKLVYLTDASPRKIKIGKTEIVFKKTTPKNLSFKSELCMLVAQALKEIGKDLLKAEEEEKILTLLRKEDYKKLKHDIGIAPQWIAEIMAKALPL